MVYFPATKNSEPICFEVDSTESLWYIKLKKLTCLSYVLKLTPPSHYGISESLDSLITDRFEVDSTESLWYTIGCK